jgi:ribosomal protein L29
MKKTDKISYQQKSVAELTKSLTDTAKSLVELKIKHASGNQKDTSVFKKLRYQMALIKTIIKQHGQENK